MFTDDGAFGKDDLGDASMGTIGHAQIRAKVLGHDDPHADVRGELIRHFGRLGLLHAQLGRTMLVLGQLAGVGSKFARPMVHSSWRFGDDRAQEHLMMRDFLQVCGIDGRWKLLRRSVAER